MGFAWCDSRIYLFPVQFVKINLSGLNIDEHDSFNRGRHLTVHVAVQQSRTFEIIMHSTKSRLSTGMIFAKNACPAMFFYHTGYYMKICTFNFVGADININ